MMDDEKLSFDVDELVKKIDAKIAELEAEEKRELEAKEKKKKEEEKKQKEQFSREPSNNVPVNSINNVLTEEKKENTNVQPTPNIEKLGEEKKELVDLNLDDDLDDDDFFDDFFDS